MDIRIDKESSIVERGKENRWRVPQEGACGVARVGSGSIHWALVAAETP